MLSSCVYNTTCSKFKTLKIPYLCSCETYEKNNFSGSLLSSYLRWTGNPKSFPFPMNKKVLEEIALNWCLLNEAGCCPPSSFSVALSITQLYNKSISIPALLLDLLSCSSCSGSALLTKTLAYFSHCQKTKTWHSQLLSLWNFQYPRQGKLVFQNISDSDTVFWGNFISSGKPVQISNPGSLSSNELHVSRNQIVWNCLEGSVPLSYWKVSSEDYR